MDIKNVTKVYNHYSYIYDSIFGKILDAGRKKVIKLMSLEANQKIIEFGIGTGLSLKNFPKHINLEITGIDLSDKMLEKAELRKLKYPNLDVSLYNMNAEKTTFKDNTFDKVVLMYIYSVTPNPKELLAEAFRICKLDGEIYIVNHFSNSKKDTLTFLERIISSFSNTVGFRSDFSYNKYIESLKINIDTIETANILSLTKVIRFQKIKNLHLQNLVHKKTLLNKEQSLVY